jgi:predicted amidohydrolase
MNLSVLLVQMPVTEATSENVACLRSAVAEARPGDLVVTPEAAVSGYSEDMDFLQRLSPSAIEAGLDELAELALRQQITICAGSCLWEHDAWSNAAILLQPSGARCIYRKVNLATAERDHMNAGNELPTFELRPPMRAATTVGIQLCRELRYPEQWLLLSQRGAQAIIHLNNAVGDRGMFPVWRSHLISRAAENQRFVISVNNAVADQKAPSIVVAPTGHVLCELAPDELGVQRVELPLNEVGDYYISQRRDDLTRQPSSASRQNEPIL